MELFSQETATRSLSTGRSGEDAKAPRWNGSNRRKRQAHRGPYASARVSQQLLGRLVDSWSRSSEQPNDRNKRSAGVRRGIILSPHEGSQNKL